MIHLLKPFSDPPLSDFERLGISMRAISYQSWVYKHMIDRESNLLISDPTISSGLPLIDQFAVIEICSLKLWFHEFLQKVLSNIW